MRPTILTFNFTDGRLSKLRFLCMKLGVLVKPVPAEDWRHPLSVLCGMSAPADSAAESAPAEPFADELLVFCQMDNAAVGRFLQTAKQLRFAPVALKAVLTPTNAAWTPAQLHRELSAERAAILRGQTADH